jgi:hypothetical protein
MILSRKVALLFLKVAEIVGSRLEAQRAQQENIPMLEEQRWSLVSAHGDDFRVDAYRRYLVGRPNTSEFCFFFFCYLFL